jgi:hypothetical protein
MHLAIVSASFRSSGCRSSRAFNTEAASAPSKFSRIPFVALLLDLLLVLFFAICFADDSTFDSMQKRNPAPGDGNIQLALKLSF